MATLGGSFLTIGELAKREDPNGMPAQIAELLHQTNGILDDIPFMQSNLPTAHRTTQRTGLPGVSKRRYNKGIAPTRSSADQIVDTIASFETHAHTDVKLMQHASDKMGVRLQENAAHIEALGQAVANDLFYGDATNDPEEFNGLMPRYDVLDGLTADNILNGAGTGDLTSIWLVGWAPGKITGIHPKHGTAGIMHDDLGLQYIQDATGPAGAALPMFVDIFSWDVGIAVQDWRYAVRVCNIDIDQAMSVASPHALTQATNPLKLMARALHRIPNLEACRPVFYMNRSLFEAFDVQQMNATLDNVFKTVDVQGRLMTTFRQIPIRICDQISSAETAVAAA